MALAVLAGESAGGVLDLGCGSGEPIARKLMERGCKVTGVDSAPSLVALCPARAFRKQSGASPICEASR